LIYIFWGENNYTIDEAVRELKQSFSNDPMLSSNTNVLEGQKLGVNDFKLVGEAMPFLSANRLVIVNGLLQRFEPKDPGKAKASKAKKPKKKDNSLDEAQAFADCIKGLPPTTVLVLVDVIEMKKGTMTQNPLYDAVAGSAEVKPFPLLKGTRLNQWIQDRVNRLGSGISQQALKILVEYASADLFSLENEINKLVAFTGGGMIEEKDVRSVVSASQEADIFALMDAVMDRKVAVAEKILENLFHNGVAAPQILALLSRQVATLVQVKDLKSQKKSPREIQFAAGIFSQYVFDKANTRAAKYTFDDLKNIYHALLATDLSIKTGKMESDLALNTLIADLCVK